MCVFINCIDNMKVGGDIICNCQYLEGKLHCKRHVIQVSKNSCLKKLKYFREVGGDLICTCHCVGRHICDAIVEKSTGEIFRKVGGNLICTCQQMECTMASSQLALN